MMQLIAYNKNDGNNQFEQTYKQQQVPNNDLNCFFLAMGVDLSTYLY
jgi:hypothetical protein